jgi:hypothetical protein
MAGSHRFAMPHAAMYAGQCGDPDDHLGFFWEAHDRTYHGKRAAFGNTDHSMVNGLHLSW